MTEFISPFGPMIMHSKLSDECFNILRANANDSRQEDLDFRQKLSGNIHYEYKINFKTHEHKNLVVDELLSFAKQYVNACREQYRVKRFNEVKAKNLQIIDPIWVNFMRNGEWNPVHFHAGQISCVIYLSIPDEINEENKVDPSVAKSNQPTAGKIQWTYGEAMHFSQTFYTKTPREQDIFLFPADLKHFVYPFKTNAERVSVSCNFIAPNFKIAKTI